MALNGKVSRTPILLEVIICDLFPGSRIKIVFKRVNVDMPVVYGDTVVTGTSLGSFTRNVSRTGVFHIMRLSQIRTKNDDCHGWLGCSPIWTSIFDEFFLNIYGRISAITRRMLSSNGQAFVAYPHRSMTLHSPAENTLAVLNHKILRPPFTGPNVKLGGHQTCLSINRLWHELCDMLRRLVETTALGHQE
ncbi:hypothetical protein TNCV_4362661 [Trichonephila clavipes]|nr:hypothetical protein TNCV_4362661 [Trichonephila clavipes]